VLPVGTRERDAGSVKNRVTGFKKVLVRKEKKKGVQRRGGRRAEVRVR